jgi:hypothetical protein
MVTAWSNAKANQRASCNQPPDAVTSTADDILITRVHLPRSEKRHAMRAKYHSTPSVNTDVPTRIALLGASSETITKSRSPPTSASAWPCAFKKRFASTATNESRRARASNCNTLGSASPNSIASALRCISLFSMLPAFSVYRCSDAPTSSRCKGSRVSSSAAKTNGCVTLTSNSRGKRARALAGLSRECTN